MIHPYIKYSIRWQLSTPILAVCIILIPGTTLVQTIIANLIGSAIFYNVDKKIFNNKLNKLNNKKLY